jgi:tRNA(adenine34) deaminase
VDAVIPTADDRRWLALALHEAREASDAGEVPVAAVVVCDGREIARAQNRMVREADATAHAEVLALRAATRALGEARLGECTLYITLEPCAMCAGAIVLARIGRVVFSAWDDKAGMAGSVGDLLRHPKLNHRPHVLGGVEPESASALLRAFFAAARAAG